MRQALADSQRVQLSMCQAIASLYLAETLLPIDADEAREVAEAGLKLARELAYRAHEGELLRVSAAALAATDPAAAEARAGEALALARSLGTRPEEGHALRVLGDIQVKQGREDAARVSHNGARAIYQDLGMRYWLERIG